MVTVMMMSKPPLSAQALEGAAAAAADSDASPYSDGYGADGRYTNGIPSWQSSLLNTIALSVLALSIMSCLILIGLAVRSRRFSNTADRFPLYLAILKLGWSIPQVYDYSYSALNAGFFPPKNTCTVIGGTLMTFIAAELLLSCTMSVATMLSVLRGRPLNLGRGDSVLVVSTFLETAAWVAVGASFGGFGPDFYWCLFNIHSPNWRIFTSIGAAATSLIIIIPLACGLVVYRQIFQIWRRTSERAVDYALRPTVSIQTIRAAIFRKILQVELVTAVTFVPSAAYCFVSAVAQRVPYAFAVAVAALVNCGGMMLLAVYVRQMRRPPDGERIGSGTATSAQWPEFLPEPRFTMDSLWGDGGVGGVGGGGGGGGSVTLARAEEDGFGDGIAMGALGSPKPTFPPASLQPSRQQWPRRPSQAATEDARGDPAVVYFSSKAGDLVN